MSTRQIWQLPFKLPDLQLDAARTFNIFGCELSLSPVNTNGPEGYLCFEMYADTIDEEKAKTFGSEWIQRNLVDSYLLAFGMNLKPEFSEPILLNKSELASVKRTRYVRMLANAYIKGSLSIADVEKSLRLTERLETHANKDLLERSPRWFVKAKHTGDFVDSFVMQWIAFNALYAIFDHDQKGDRIAIKNLINKHPTTQEIGEILAEHDETVKKLASKELKDRHQQKNYSEELKELIGNQDVRSTLRAVCLCLWVVRNQIFHGGTMPSEEINFIRECSQLNEKIYRKCFCSYVGLT